jgi:hypothetical protein
VSTTTGLPAAAARGSTTKTKLTAQPKQNKASTDDASQFFQSEIQNPTSSETPKSKVASTSKQKSNTTQHSEAKQVKPKTDGQSTPNKMQGEKINNAQTKRATKKAKQ